MGTNPSLARNVGLLTLLLSIIPTASVRAQIRPEVTPPAIEVLTSPGATIFWDDVQIGFASLQGKLTIRNSAAGLHDLRIEQRSKRTFEQKVKVAQGTIHITAPLSDVTGDLEIFTTPNAEIFLHDQRIGVADATGHFLQRKLKVQKYDLRVQSPGFSTEYKCVELAADIVTAATIHLFPISASLKDAQGLAPPHYVCDRQLAFDSGNLAPLGLFFLHGVSQLVSWNDREITVWEADSGRQLRSIKVAGKMSFFEISHDLQWATKWDDEKPALSKTDWTAWTQIGHEQSDFKMTGRFVGFNRDLDAIILAIKDDPDRMEFRDLRVGKELRKWENVLVENLIEGPDKQWMITRDYGGGVDVRDADTGKVSRLMATRVDQIVLSPDSRLLAARNLDSIQFFGIRDTSRGLNIPAPDGPYRTNSYRAWFLDLVFTPDNRYLISANNPDVFIWSIATGEQIQHLKFPDLAGGVVQFHILAISDDGHWFAVNYHHGITLCRLDK